MIKSFLHITTADISSLTEKCYYFFCYKERLDSYLFQQVSIYNKKNCMCQYEYTHRHTKNIFTLLILRS